MTNEEIDKRNEEISKANSEKIAARLKNKYDKWPCYTKTELYHLHDALLWYMKSIDEGLYLYGDIEKLCYDIDYILDNNMYDEKK